MNTNTVLTIGFILIIAGFFAIMIGSVIAAFRADSDAKVSVVGLIGFIPFGFSNDKRLLVVSLVIMLIIMAASFAMLYFRRY